MSVIVCQTWADETVHLLCSLVFVKEKKYRIIRVIHAVVLAFFLDHTFWSKELVIFPDIYPLNLEFQNYGVKKKKNLYLLFIKAIPWGVTYIYVAN